RVHALHSDARISRSTVPPCDGESSPGWQMLDNSPASIGIVAFGRVNAPDEVIQLHSSGHIFKFTGMPCNGESCHGWQMLDNNSGTLALAAGRGQLHQPPHDCRIFQWTRIASGHT